MWGAIESGAHITKRVGQFGMLGSILAGFGALAQIDAKYPGYLNMKDSEKDAFLAPHTDTSQDFTEWGPEEVYDVFPEVFWGSASITLLAFIIEQVASGRRKSA